MKLRVLLASTLALSFLAMPALAKPDRGPPGASAAASKKRDPAQRQARKLAALKQAGVEDARAKRVLSAMTQRQAQAHKIHAQMKPHRDALRKLMQSKSRDEAAFKRALDGLDAGRKQLRTLNDKHEATVAQILKPSERAQLRGGMKRNRGPRRERPNS